ncbi:4'-phosphopantetheinyl transferase family protein [Salinisphaera sp. RV14]|uniref:4'-phosphopantetheinyl transferase family protein n=1 Tax=unclassified Salinisphaera TaxID=2649847 RepID=UPI003F876140
MLVVYIVLDPAREALFAERSATRAPPAYRARVEAMGSAAARARTMAGLWLLEQGLALLDLPPERIEGLGFGAGGRPQFADGPSFSISHSGGLVACAVDAEGVIGLDVEQRRDGVSPRLRRWVAPDGDFFAAWCAREAAVKASGRVGLARIRATTIDGAFACLDGHRWHLLPLSLAPGYAACLAAARTLAPAAIGCVDAGDRLSRARAG